MSELLSSSFFWAQIFGAFAMAAGIVSWQLRTSKKIMGCLTITDLAWAIQYFLLGAPTGGLIALTASIRNFCSAYMGKKVIQYVVIAYMTGCIIITLWSFKDWFDILPLIGTIIFSTCLLTTKERTILARANFVTNGFWTTYAFFTVSYFGFAFGIIMAFSTLIGMARHEEWEIGKCYRTFIPSLTRSLFATQNFRTYP